jgi:hypothetical protein
MVGVGPSLIDEFTIISNIFVYYLLDSAGPHLDLVSNLGIAVSHIVNTSQTTESKLNHELLLEICVLSFAFRFNHYFFDLISLRYRSSASESVQ